jgi:hypothetical protein
MHIRRSSILLLAATCSCGAADRRFALREPLTTDTDLRDASVPCRAGAAAKDARVRSDTFSGGRSDPSHASCPPAEYVSPLVWDGTDNLFFRPLAELWAFRAPSEAVNANSLDEIPDSSWFTNRLGVRAVPTDELVRGACTPDEMLDADHDADGSWVIDRGKSNGSSLGFRVNVRGRKYLFKVDSDAPERSSAASVVGAAAYQAVGFNTSCEQVVYLRPSLLKLTPGLTYQGNFSVVRPFDQAALDHILSLASRKNGRLRFQASAWLPGHLIGPFQYTGTRPDDPNDAIAHEDRRELRGGRVLAAWLDHFDAREQNSMDSWITPGKGAPEGSPGHVVHYYLDTSDALGSAWDWEPITRRLGYSYVVDWTDMGRDFVTLGIPLRPWDRVKRVPGREIFNYFDVDNFEADEWKNEYANPAFDRMTERDAAWMARILARLSPDMVRTLAGMAQFTDPSNTEYLANVLEGRLEKILERYLLRLSPIADLRMVGGDRLCGTDLAELRGMRDPARFAYSARLGRSWLSVDRPAPAAVCVTLVHVAQDGGMADDARERYVRIELADGVAHGRLVAHLYDLGPVRGFRLVGVERRER